ncbi:hypothetical protein MRX96_034195 [Rhipicephalus microplus]
MNLRTTIMTNSTSSTFTMRHRTRPAFSSLQEGVSAGTSSNAIKAFNDCVPLLPLLAEALGAAVSLEDEAGCSNDPGRDVKAVALGFLEVAGWASSRSPGLAGPSAVAFGYCGAWDVAFLDPALHYLLVCLGVLSHSTTSMH